MSIIRICKKLNAILNSQSFALPLKVKAIGTVYNLKKLTDFEGTFTGFSGGLTLVKELYGFVNLENARGVIVSVKSANKGVRLSAPAPGGVHVSFQR